MALNITERVLTVVVTATLTSAVWIVAGGSLIENADSQSQLKTTRPADAAPSPAAVAALPVDPAEKAGEVTRSTVSLNETTSSNASESETRDLLIPVLNIRPSDLTDTFMDSRSGGDRLHEAIDIMAPKGTSVLAAAPGQIEKIFESEAGGKTIYIRSNDGQTIHYYAHLDNYAEGLNEGQRIRRSQRLGSVGSTGNASKEVPHLHFAIFRTTKDAKWWEPANAVNPYPLLVKEHN